jgi:hypothetical protein
MTTARHQHPGCLSLPGVHVLRSRFSSKASIVYFRCSDTVPTQYAVPFTMTEPPSLPPPLRPGWKGNFPGQLHHVLSEMAADGLDHIASWQPHGRSFKVHDQNAFVQNILAWYVWCVPVYHLDTCRHPGSLIVTPRNFTVGSANLSSLPFSDN